MKVTLFTINASYAQTALGIRCLRGGLERAGFCVELYEPNLKERRDEVLEHLDACACDILGVSVYLWNREEILMQARCFHQLHPSVPILLGGPEVWFEDESFFDAYPFVDGIISGEGEEMTVALCEMLRLGTMPRHRIWQGKPYSDFAKTGILYRPNEQHDGALIYYESSRGCPYRCSYCLSGNETDGVGLRSKPETLVLSEMAEMERMAHIGTVKFVDRTFNADRQRAKKIWQALAGENYTKEYHFEICAALLDAESIAILKNVPKGKFRLEAGVQSTNPETLKAIGRNDDTAQILANLSALSGGNVHVHADLIAGLPYEDYQSFARSFDMVFGKCDHLQLGFLKLLRGTRIRTQAQEYGYEYEQNPPYTVLKNNFISYGELRQMHHISDLLERLSNSAVFPMTNRAIFHSRIGMQPFAFFEQLSAFLRTAEKRHLTKIGQQDFYRLLCSYFVQNAPQEEQEVLLEGLALDFLLYETGEVPKEFRPAHSFSQAQEKEIITAFLRRHQCPPGGFDLPLTVHALCVMPSQHLLKTTVILDRKGHHLYSADS